MGITNLQYRENKTFKQIKEINKLKLKKKWSAQMFFQITYAKKLSQDNIFNKIRIFSTFIIKI